MEPIRLTALIAGQRYDTAMATLIADDAYWDGHSYERSGRNRFLFRTQLRGLYFVLTRSLLMGEEDEIGSLSREQAEAMWEDLPRRNFTFEEAFPESVGAPLTARVLVAETLEVREQLPPASGTWQVSAPGIESPAPREPAPDPRAEDDPEGPRPAFAAEDSGGGPALQPGDAPEAALTVEPGSNGAASTESPREPGASESASADGEPSARRGRARPQRAKGSGPSPARKASSQAPRTPEGPEAPGIEGTLASAAPDPGESDPGGSPEAPAAATAITEMGSDETPASPENATEQLVSEPANRTPVPDLPGGQATAGPPGPPEATAPATGDPSSGDSGHGEEATKEADLWLDDTGEWQAKGVVRHGSGRLRLIGNELHITSAGVSGRFRKSRWSRDEAIPLEDISQIGVRWGNNRASLEIQFRGSSRSSMRLADCRPPASLEQLLDEVEANAAGVTVRRIA